MRYKSTCGLTLTEVLISLALLAVVSAVLSTSFVSVMQTNSKANSRVRASQLLTAIAEQVSQHKIVVSDSSSIYYAYLPTSTTVAVATGNPISECSTYLSSTEGRGNFCVKVSNAETFNPSNAGVYLLSSPARLYTVQVNWKDGEVNRTLETKSIY